MVRTMKLVLVVGPPRSGTSVIARILHEKVGICMGHDLVRGNEGNPLGFYEDFSMVAATKKKHPLTWLDTLNRNHTVADCNKAYGVKSPELAFMDINRLCPDIVIRTQRNPADIAVSLLRYHRPRITPSNALLLIARYEKAIDNQLANLSCLKYQVDLRVQRDEKELEYELRKVCASVV